MNGITDEEFAAMLEEIDQAAAKAQETLDGKFSKFYKKLRALDPADVEAITPDTNDEVEYERLLSLVQAATRENLSQAQLVSRIRALGATAVEIAKKASAFPDELLG